jgi:glycosyltransferase involved in cell wall biosynthesis
MNIYLYLKHFDPYGEKLNDGTSRAVHGLASGLVNCGAKVTVLCEHQPSTFAETAYVTKAGYEIRCFANRYGSSPSFNLAPGLQNFVRDALDSHSLVVLNGLFHASVYSLSRLLNKYKIPYILAPHNPYSPAIFNKNPHLKWPYWHLFEKTLLRKAKAIQVLDSRQSQFIQELNITVPVFSLPNGFALQEIPQEIAPSRLTENSPVKLLFFGRLDAYNKGLDILLTAFANIAQTENIHLTIQGPDQGDKQNLQTQAAKLNISHQVSFIDPDFQTPPAVIMQNYQVICIPSRFEGFSLAALEAMLVERVLLISDVAGIAPHIEASGCGVVVAPEVSAMTLGIKNLLQRRSQWSEMGVAGKHYALEHLQWDKIASVALQKYQQLVA